MLPFSESLRFAPEASALPPLLYGTAWKEDDTERLVKLALKCGFRGIDTANQRKHYHEAQVGSAIQSSGLKREELFLQTKFTFRAGQDQRLPYDPKASIAKQVEQSFESSLQHLGVSWLDSYVLHGPSRRSGWHEEDQEAWAAMEALHASGRAKVLGVSNVSVEQLEALCASSRLRPRYVQNRCYARMGWDEEVRGFCERHSMQYQGFSLLTANPEVLRSDVVQRAAKRLSKTPAQIVFRFAIDVGMLPLTGTTDEQHMREDLALDFALTEAELRGIARPGS